MIDPQISVALISAIGGILATWLTVKYRDQQKKKVPKDRTEQLFDGYERLIHQQQDEIGRKGQLIDSLQEIVDHQKQEIEKSQNLIDQLSQELEHAKERTKLLEQQLNKLKNEYKITKNGGRV